MAITTDWHIHTKCSCDSACMEFETLISDAKKLGITDFGVSDHYHTRLQEGDIASSRREYDAALERHPELIGHFHFGMEATVISKWEVDRIARGDYTEPPIYGFRTGGPKNADIMFDFDEEFLKKYKIEYVVAGMHWPMFCDTDLNSVIKEYHRQYMFAATHPHTDILAHYLWWDRGLFQDLWNLPDYKNPFADFSVIPQSMKSELKAVLLENNVAFELNDCFFSEGHRESFKNAYLEWVAELQESGVKISMGSDCHSPSLSVCCNYREFDEICRRYGINTSDFYVVGGGTR